MPTQSRGHGTRLSERQDLPRPFVRRSLRMIRRLATVVDLPPAIRSYVSADPGDNPVIQTALTGKADSVVTADKALLALGKVQDVEIISLDEFPRCEGPPSQRHL